MNLVMALGMRVCVKLSISVCMIVSNASIMSNATVMVHSGGCFWLKPVAIVLLMQCSAVSVVFAFISVLCCDVQNVFCNAW